jgi:hypothetical protein
VNGQVRQQATGTIVAGTQTPLALEAQPQIAQGGTPAPGSQPQIAQKKGKSPLPFIILGGAGAGAAVFVLSSKKSSTPQDTSHQSAGTGTITVSVPVNP